MMDARRLPAQLLRYLPDSTLELLGWDGISGTLTMTLTKEIGPEQGTLRFFDVSHINLPPFFSIAGIEQVPPADLKAEWPGLGDFGAEDAGFLILGSWGERYFVMASSLDYVPRSGI
jgi:hypothetical protein